MLSMSLRLKALLTDAYGTISPSLSSLPLLQILLPPTALLLNLFYLIEVSYDET